MNRIEKLLLAVTLALGLVIVGTYAYVETHTLHTLGQTQPLFVCAPDSKPYECK